MQYRLRTLLILLAVGPPVLALVLVNPAGAVFVGLPVALFLWDLLWS